MSCPLFFLYCLRSDSVVDRDLSAAIKFANDLTRTIAGKFTFFDDHLAAHDGRVITLTPDDNATAVMREVIDVFRMTGGQSLIVNHVQVSMPAFFDPRHGPSDPVPGPTGQ